MKITMEYIRFITVANLKKEALYPRIAAHLPLTCYDTKLLISELNGFELKILLKAVQIGKFDEKQLLEIEELQEYCMLVGKELFLSFLKMQKVVL